MQFYEPTFSENTSEHHFQWVIIPLQESSICHSMDSRCKKVILQCKALCKWVSCLIITACEELSFSVFKAEELHIQGASETCSRSHKQRSLVWLLSRVKRQEFNTCQIQCSSCKWSRTQAQIPQGLKASPTFLHLRRIMSIPEPCFADHWIGCISLGRWWWKASTCTCLIYNGKGRKLLDD